MFDWVLPKDIAGSQQERYGLAHIYGVAGDYVKLLTVRIPEAQIEGLDELVRMGMYPSRSAAIRAAVRDLMKREFWRTEPYMYTSSSRRG